MKRLNPIVPRLVLLSSLTLSACGFQISKGNDDTSLGGSTTTSLSYASVQENVINKRCISCHSGSDEVPLDTYERVVHQMDKIRRDVFTQKSMPKDGPLNALQSDLLLKWLDAGAPEFEVASANPKPAETPTDPGARPVDIPNVNTGYDQIKDKILASRNCLKCHVAGGAADDVPLASVEDLKNGGMLDFSRPENSRLYRSLTRSDATVLPMPPKKRTELLALSAEELSFILGWIKSGAPATARTDIPATPLPPLPGGAPISPVVPVVPPVTPPVVTPPVAPPLVPPPVTVPPTLPKTYTAIKEKILSSRNCFKCHASGASGEDVPLDTVANLKQGALLDLANPEQSKLYRSLTRNDDQVLAMPPKKRTDLLPLNGDELAIIRDWIKEGAPE